MINLNKLFPRLSIRSKLLIAFAGLSFIPVALLGIYAVISNVQLMEKNALEDLDHGVQIITEKTENFLTHVEGDLQYLTHSVSFQELIAQLEKHPRQIGEESIVASHNYGKGDNLLKRIGSELLAFASSKKKYYQIRVVNRDGAELVRIEADDLDRGDETFRIVPPEELRRARELWYKLLIGGSTPGQITFAPAELFHKQRNKFIPVISFALPLGTGETWSGILIANVFARDFFHAIEAQRSRTAGTGTVAIVNNEGYYLYHSEKKNEWNKLLASKEEENLRVKYYGQVVGNILSGETGTITKGTDDIISYKPLFLQNKHFQYNQTGSSFKTSLFVIKSIPKEALKGPVYEFALISGFLLILFLAVAVGLALLATGQFTKPISALRRGAERVARGNYSHRIKVETNDEIEELAHQFNTMADSLESHVNVLNEHRTRLEEMVEHRTVELRDEKNKLQAIIDNVPSAFVLLDHELRILTASSAFNRLTGRRIEEVVGIDCREVFCEGGFCRECICESALTTGEIRNNVYRIYNNDGNEQYIEHVAIPLKKNGQNASVLEVITDVTERKKMEEYLLQSEKMISMGKISAVVAHSFRNSLTSTKMILQLHRESQKLTNREKSSLDVALESIEQMENIVSNLLNFSRPRPMERKRVQLNILISESIDFIRIQAERNNINLDFVKDNSVPPVYLDEARFQEALVNILLNAIDAIKNKDGEGEENRIWLETKTVVLKENIRNLSYSGIFEGRSGISGPKEIILKQDTTCALVEIRDTGCGIDEGNLKKIFEPFFTTKIGGTGLGLPIVMQTINALGGVVKVQSEKNKETTFSIYLPMV